MGASPSTPTAVCQPGEQAVGGGGTGGGGDPLVSSYPTFQSGGPATGWEVFEAGDSNNAKNPPAAAVICASP